MDASLLSFLILLCEDGEYLTQSVSVAWAASWVKGDLPGSPCGFRADRTTFGQRPTRFVLAHGVSQRFAVDRDLHRINGVILERCLAELRLKARNVTDAAQ